MSRQRPAFLVAGDVNGFFGLVVDNISVLALLSGVLIAGYGMPADVVFGRMLPGTAFGVLVGDLAYAWLAVRLARRTGRSDVTAMPLGIDTPSTIGMTLLVLGPAFLRFRAEGLDAESAALETWYVGMAATVIMGLFKVLLSFTGRRVRALMPQAALLGSIAGIALMLIGFFPLVELLRMPVVGFVTLGIVLFTLTAGGSAPWRVPGVLFAILVGMALYYVLGPLGLAGGTFHPPPPLQLRLALPWPDVGILRGFAGAVDYLPLILPFALLTIVGGVNVTESASVAGDSYDTRSILLTEAVATLAAGITGGVAQTTPYIGHPAYKRMGARIGYVVLAGLFIGLGGMLGFLASLIEFIPLAVLAPILVFVAMEITVQAFHAVPQRHAAAVAFSFFPAIARLVAIKLGDPSIVPPEQFASLMTASEKGLPNLAVLVALGNGFIITAMVWAGFLAALVDRRLRNAVLFLLAGGVLTAFGIIHSAHPDGSAYLPWNLTGLSREVAAGFCAGYFALAFALAMLSLRQPWRSTGGRNDPQ